MVGFLLNVPTTFIYQSIMECVIRATMTPSRSLKWVQWTFGTSHYFLRVFTKKAQITGRWGRNVKCKTVSNTFCLSLYCNAVMYCIAQGHVVILAPIFSARTKDKQTQINSSHEWRCSAHIAELLNDSCEADISVEGLLLDKTVA